MESKNINRGYQNLHTHTTTSDGKLTYKEVLDISAENNTSVVAFTDHDSLPGPKNLKTLEKNRNHPVKWIIGTEISSGWPKETGGGAASNFHIVGLFVDPYDKALQKHCRKAKAGRRERMERMVKNLNRLGFSITKEDCLKESGGEVVGRPHIVSALEKRRKNRQIIKGLLDKLKNEAESNPSLQKKVETIEQRPDQAPYLLFLSPNAYIKDVFVPYLYFKEMDESVELIRNAGGVALLAHWTFCRKKVPADLVDKFLKEKRLDGAEIVFGVDKKKSLEDSRIKKDMKTMTELTKKHKALQSGGGDSHAKEDFERFGRTRWLAEKTKGMVEKMNRKKKLNLKFSSLDL